MITYSEGDPYLLHLVQARTYDIPGLDQSNGGLSKSLQGFGAASLQSGNHGGLFDTWMEYSNDCALRQTHHQTSNHGTIELNCLGKTTFSSQETRIRND